MLSVNDFFSGGKITKKFATMQEFFPKIRNKWIMGS